MRIDEPAARSLSDKPFYYFCDFNFGFGATGFDGVPDLVEKKGYLVNVYRGKRDADGRVTYRKNDGDSFDITPDNLLLSQGAHADSLQYDDFRSRIDIDIDGKADPSRFWETRGGDNAMQTVLLSKLSDKVYQNIDGKFPLERMRDVNRDGVMDRIDYEEDSQNVPQKFVLTAMWDKPVDSLFKIDTTQAKK